MKFPIRIARILMIFSFFLVSGSTLMAQSSCCGGEGHDEATCTEDHASTVEATSGCAPSSCRGAQTKFGEAKVITSLRNTLVALKSDMEVHKGITFNNRSYDVHSIVGESDEESLQIIAKEVKLIENDFSTKLNTKFEAFQLPENSAKIVQYLKGRIKSLQGLL